MQTFHIHINGIVQGVGFRPMVYHLANEMKLSGYVKNGNDGVHVFFNASAQTANFFLKKIIQQAPQQSKIISSELSESAKTFFPDFSIHTDEDKPEKKVLLSPDLAICADCRNELHDINNLRYRYPFITCTQCGPRYSIIESIPYERHNTGMDNFMMCKNCSVEYENVSDRRFFSQTNSCKDCGVGINIPEDESFKSEVVLLQIKSLLEKGKILAIKGVGGFLLICDANNTETIRLLRRRKHRPSKPFAVLYPDIKTINDHFQLNGQEEALLQSSSAPIVLLYPRLAKMYDLPVLDIAPGLNRLGIMLPCSAFLDLIVKDFGRPLIATSANISGSPIIYREDDAHNYLSGIADHIIDYDRDIVVPQDDSVLQVSKHTGQQIILRRSRGYAPSFLNYKPRTDKCILSTGALLKSSFSLSVNKNVFVSQFLGSGESFESQQMYKHTLTHLLSLYWAKPAVIIADIHPDYFTHQYAIELSERNNVEAKFIQHHEAHFAAVLAENNLLHSTVPVLGVIWDGTGLGTDGNIWGGEIFKYENNEMLRCYHFDYFPAIAGDKLALEPRIAALCASSDTWPQPETLKEKFTDSEWNNYQALIEKSSLFSSSVGRIFDAVASLLNICDKQTYEGEAAMYLQSLAEEYVDENGFVMDNSYFKEDAHYYRIPTASLIQGIMMDVKKGKAKKYIAAKFHFSLVCLVDIVAKNIGAEKISFSGGVFQNALLVDWIQLAYKEKYQIYFHKDLSPNDENISFGQMVYYDNNIKSLTKEDFFSKEKEQIRQVVM